MHELDADRIVVSPINVGGGTVKCAHGILPVPAPATALLLEGLPSYESDSIKSELCTPTGAALAKYFAFDFASQPVMNVKKIGYGIAITGGVISFGAMIPMAMGFGTVG